ncbi:MAG: hypothetical protein P4M02_08810 [Clostridia bacterium]|nr:hypothetical protein [Clostridia bacterium]
MPTTGTAALPPEGCSTDCTKALVAAYEVSTEPGSGNSFEN